MYVCAYQVSESLGVYGGRKIMMDMVAYVGVGKDDCTGVYSGGE